MKISVYLTLGLMIVSALGGVGFGYWLTPEYRIGMSEENSMNLGRADRTFDLRYLNAMIAHHRGAMLLAEQLLQKTGRSEMRELGQKILKDEPVAIAELYSWKKSWYGDTRSVRDPIVANLESAVPKLATIGDTRSVRDPIVANLGTADSKFDLRFINALISHHEAGILMTGETRKKSSRAEILNNIDSVEASLKDGLIKLKALRNELYKI